MAKQFSWCYDNFRIHSRRAVAQLPPTHRIAGSGGAIPTNDPNMTLDTANGRLFLGSVRSDNIWDFSAQVLARV